MFYFTQPIRFSHCDPAAVLYFPHVFDFVNAAVEDWFGERLGVPFHAWHLEHRRGNPVVRTRCDFARPCRFGETLVLELEPTSVGRSSLEMRIVGRVGGEERFRVRHKTAMISMDTLRSIAIPEELRARATAELGEPQAGPFGPVEVGKAPPSAFRSRQLVRYAHCDPGERVYFARFFDMFNAVLEDWPRDLRAPSLAIDAEFLHACVLGEILEFELWVTQLGRSSLELAIAGAVDGEARLRARWTRALDLHQGQ